MTTLRILEGDIPTLHGRAAIVTGGSSGIGLSAAKILAAKGATVHILDIEPPEGTLLKGLSYIKCDQSQWSQLATAFAQIGEVHIAIANAGISEDGAYLTDSFDQDGNLLEPNYRVIDVNLRGTLNFIKLCLHNMKTNTISGSIVITTSATAHSAEQSLPLYSGVKAALANFMRAMRSTLCNTGITINCVAPAATITNLLPEDLASPIIANNLPVSSAYFVAVAVVYSAVAFEEHKVQSYGKDTEEWRQTPGRWNGRTILTHGNRYTELEEPLSESRKVWLGEANLHETTRQQAATDFRP